MNVLINNRKMTDVWTNLGFSRNGFSTSIDYDTLWWCVQRWC